MVLGQSLCAAEGSTVPTSGGRRTVHGEDGASGSLHSSGMSADESPQHLSAVIMDLTDKKMI